MNIDVLKQKRIPRSFPWLVTMFTTGAAVTGSKVISQQIDEKKKDKFSSTHVQVEKNDCKFIIDQNHLSSVDDIVMC